MSLVDAKNWVNNTLQAAIGKSSYDDLQRILTDYERQNPGCVIQVQDFALGGAFAGLVFSYCWIVISEQRNLPRRQLVDTMAGGAIAGAIIVLGLSRVAGYTYDPQPRYEVAEYLEWPNQRQFKFFQSLLIPYTPARATEHQASSLAKLEACQVCMEDQAVYVLYLSCNHAVICSSCEIHMLFTRFTKLMDRGVLAGSISTDQVLDADWFRSLVVEHPTRFQFVCMQCQVPCPIEKRVLVEREDGAGLGGPSGVPEGDSNS